MDNAFSKASGISTRLLRIGDWTLDASLNEVRRGDVTVRLEPKAIEVLAYLARHSGEVVGREQLLSAVWPGAVVGDDTLTQAVIKLRKALGDDARRPAFIETISKRGYRLIAAVGETPEGIPGGSPASEGVAEPGMESRAATAHVDLLSSEPLSPRIRQRKTWAVAAMVSGLLAVAVLVLQAVLPQSSPSGLVGAGREGAAPPGIAVLPLANLSGDTQHDYFSDGVTEDIIAALGHFSTLRVMSLNAVMPFKTRHVPPQVVRTELGVRYVVSGSMRNSGGTYRVTVELSDAENGLVLWSGRFDGAGREIFEIQDRIVLQVVGTLAGNVARIEREMALTKPPGSVMAYDQVLRARALLLNVDRTSNRNARDLLDKAIQASPNYAEAHVGLGLAENQRAINGWVENPEASLKKAEEHLYRAISLGDAGARARAHSELSMVFSAQGQLEQALVEADAALDLNPSDAFVHDRRGMTLMYLGRLEEALDSMNLAGRFDPSGRGLGSLFSAALVTYTLHRYDEALRIAERALERYPKAPDLHAIRAAALAQLNRQPEAREAAADLQRVDPFFNPGVFGNRFVDPIHRAHLQAGLRKAGICMPPNCPVSG